MIVLGRILLREIGRQHRQNKRLSLADITNIVITIVNIVLLVLAVVSLHIAVKSYLDAQESGSQQLQALNASKSSLSSVLEALKKQQGTLDDSRHALEQSVKIITAQENLLQQSVQTSRKQLAVLDAQWKRQLEQPDIHAVLVLPNDLSVGIINKSKIKPLKDGHYQLNTINIDRWLGDRYQLVGTRGTDVMPLPPGGSMLPTNLALHLDPDQPIEKGNRLYGYLTVSCPDCITARVYWVLIKYGEEGYYAELSKDDKEYSLGALLRFTPSTVEDHVKHFLSRKDLIVMPTRLF